MALFQVDKQNSSSPPKVNEVPGAQTTCPHTWIETYLIKTARRDWLTLASLQRHESPNQVGERIPLS